MVKAGAGTDAAIDSSNHISIKVTSSLMVVTPSSRTLFVVIVSFQQRALTSSVPVFPAVKRGVERTFHHAWWAERSL